MESHIIENINKMLIRRGYTQTDDDSLVYRKNNSLIKVFFCLHSKLNIDRIRAFIQELEQTNIFHTIIIYDNVITSSCKKILEHMVRFTFETFHIREMSFDITEHVYYNPHEKLTNDEIRQFKDDVKNFPILLRTDPVCKYFAFQRGDIIRIRRKNGIIIYRIIK
jgi:DNA-directed RNA polymerase I, II, and III subunit RPABC1